MHEARNERVNECMSCGHARVCVCVRMHIFQIVNSSACTSMHMMNVEPTAVKHMSASRRFVYESRTFRAFLTVSLSIKIAQKPNIIRSLRPKALKYGSFEGKGK